MKRIWLATTLVICGLAQAMIGGQAARAEDKPTGAKLLPKDTLVFASVPSVSKSKDEFDKSLMGAMFRDAELKPFLDDVRKKIDEKAKEELGVSLDELLAIPQGEVTFALIERARKLAPLLMIDYGDNKETVAKLLKKLHDELKQEMEYSTQELEDVTVHVFTVKNQDPAAPFNKVVYFNEDSYLVFSSDVVALKEVLTRRKGESENTLANSDVYKYIQDLCKVDADPTTVWFTSPIGLIRSGLNIAQKSMGASVGMVAIFLPTLGVDKLKGWGGAGYYAAGDFDSITKMFLYADQPSKGIPAVFQFSAEDLAPPKWVSANTSAYFSANWDISEAYLALEKLLDGTYGAGFTGKQLDALADKDPGIHLKQDLIDVLDGKFHLVQRFEANEGGPPTTNILLALDVKDAVRMKKTLAKATQRGIETREFNGETIYELNLGGQTISLAVAAGHFVVTNDTETLEGMLRTEAQPSLVDSAPYRKIAKQFPAKLSMLSYSKSDSQMKWLYQLLKSNDNQGFLEGIDFKKLPPFEVLEKYLRASGSYTIPDKKGALYVGFQLQEGDE